MTLQKYLESQKLSVADFAKKIGVNKNNVYRYLAGRVPVPTVTALIHKTTGGKVAPNDFYLAAKAPAKKSTAKPKAKKRAA